MLYFMKVQNKKQTHRYFFYMWYIYVVPKSLGILSIKKGDTNKTDIEYQNQRTIGPVNARLISGPSISTKYTKPG